MQSMKAPPEWRTWLRVGGAHVIPTPSGAVKDPEGRDELASEIAERLSAHECQGTRENEGWEPLG